MRCLGNESWWKIILYFMSFLLKWISIGFVLPLSLILIYLKKNGTL
jgi:hypothetical protein